MKLAYEPFSTLIETSTETVSGVVVEHPRMLYCFLRDFKEAMEGREAGIVLSEDNKIIEMSKRVDFLTDFIQFDLNQKGLLTKIISSMEKIAENEEFYDSSQRLLASIENYIMDMAVLLPCDLVCGKLTIQSLLKSVGLSLVDGYSCLEERLLAYMDLARDFLGKRLFVMVNVRGLIPIENLQKMVDTALLREHEMLLIDNRVYPKLRQEKRLIVDEDLCEI